jgi:ATP-dependent Clp protease ATP-binding subunit ClpA
VYLKYAPRIYGDVRVVGAMNSGVDRFTERAKKVTAVAKEEARRFNHSYIGTEHLLLGLVDVEQGVAARVLRLLGVDLPRVREAVMFVIGRGEGPVPENPALAPRAQRMIDLAVEEARALGHVYVGTEHLLLALTHTDDRGLEGAIAIRILQGLGVDPAQVRVRVMQVLMGATGTARTRDNVVTCRVDDRTLAALDAMVEVGVYSTRSEAAARLIVAGIEANQPLLERVYAAAAQIRRVREDTQKLTQEWRATEAATPSASQEPDVNASTSGSQAPPSPGA